MQQQKIIKKTVVFILSEIRSGSTWLSYVLGNHRNTVHLGEYFRPFIIPNHIACRLCQAKGKRDCDYLYGIKDINKIEAFDFAFKRFNEKTLIDCSKRIDWLETFIHSTSFNIKIIHLHRDPRAWFASQKRRSPTLNTQDALSDWVNTNNHIEKRLNQLNINYVSAFYDELCIQPNIYFKEHLSKYLEMPFEISSLRYWEIEHHGLGGNGAAFNNLCEYSGAQVKTGDDDYYKKMNHKLFFDSRWKTELSDFEKESIESNTLVNQYLDKIGKSFQHFNSLYTSI